MSTDSTPVTVIAMIRAQSGKEAELRELLGSLIGQTRKEVGCINYDLHEVADDPTRFVFHENWQSREDLDRHLASSHVTAVLSRAGALVAEPPKMILCRKLA